MRDAIDRLWAEGGEENERILGVLKRLVGRLFAPELTREEALRLSERASKAVYLHSHMDEETFDAERIMQCCDSDCFADGSTIPICAYNILYREKEEHFMLQPRLWNDRRGGRLPVVRT